MTKAENECVTFTLLVARLEKNGEGEVDMDGDAAMDLVESLIDKARCIRERLKSTGRRKHAAQR